MTGRRGKLPPQTQWLNILEEDQRVEKRLVEIIETTEKQAPVHCIGLTHQLLMGFLLWDRSFITFHMSQEVRCILTQWPTILSTKTANYPYPNNASSDRRTQKNTILVNTINIQDASHTPAEVTGQFSFSQTLFSDNLSSIVFKGAVLVQLCTGSRFAWRCTHVSLFMIMFFTLPVFLCLYILWNA